MSQEFFANLDRTTNLGKKKDMPPPQEEWKRYSPESIGKFLQALKDGFLVERYNEYEGDGKFVTVLAKGEEKVELYEEYSWVPMLVLGSENNENRLIKYLEQLQTTIGNKVQPLPDHLL